MGDKTLANQLSDKRPPIQSSGTPVRLREESRAVTSKAKAALPKDLAKSLDQADISRQVRHLAFGGHWRDYTGSITNGSEGRLDM